MLVSNFHPTSYCQCATTEQDHRGLCSKFLDLLVVFRACARFLLPSIAEIDFLVREHPELCTYHPPSEGHPPAKRLSTAATSVVIDPTLNGAVSHDDGATITVRREDWDRICAKLVSAETSLLDLRSSVDSVNGDHGSSHVWTRSPTQYSRPTYLTCDKQDTTTHGHHVTPTFPTPTSINHTPSRPLVNDVGRHINTHGIHTTNDITGETVHIGGSSGPALFMALARGDHDRPGVQELLGKSVLPLFGLDNESATYPFVDLWGLPHGSITRLNELATALPGDQECLGFFRSHRETAHIIYPAIAEIDKFESDLLLFLLNRASSKSDGTGNQGIEEQSIYGKNFYWLGLLFATLASGCQCSSLKRKERELTSQVYVCCSFECLRLTNFFSHPSLETIQTLLILGNVISNNMNAGVAWSLLGLTIRLGQTQGLHRKCPPSTPIPMKKVRSTVWWSVVWQDSLLSISYDRASSGTMMEHPMPLDPNAAPGTRTYAECMYRLCKVGLDVVRDRSTPRSPTETLQRIIERRNEIQEIMFDAADYLKDSRRCRSMRDQLEHWSLYLHLSYITSELCRPAISPSTAEYDLSKTLRKTCIDSLTNTVEAFLGLQNMTPFASRSWAAVHRSLSAALLLGILGEPSRNERARTLLENLMSVLSDFTSKVDPAELSAPMSRAISALRKLVIRNGSGASKQATTVEGMASTSATSSSPTVGWNMPDLTGIDWNDPNLFNQSPKLDLDPDGSPYALMDSILWGVKRTPSL